jgi:hypothetical protein
VTRDPRFDAVMKAAVTVATVAAHEIHSAIGRQCAKPLPVQIST